MNPYEVLEINENASPEEIKKAYLDVCRKNHPDHGGEIEKFKQIQEAYSILVPDEKTEESEVRDLVFNTLDECLTMGNIVLCAKESLKSNLRRLESHIATLKLNAKKLKSKINDYNNTNKQSDEKELLLELLENRHNATITKMKFFDKRLNITKKALESISKLEDPANSSSAHTAPGYRDWETDRKSTRLNSSHSAKSRMPSSA